MESISYPEMLHDIFVQYLGDKDRVTPFETSVILLIEKILAIEKEKILSNNAHLTNKDIKVNCDSCSWHNTITDCGLKPKVCINNDKYTRYRKAHLLPCDRCKTYSVVTRLDKIVDKNTGNILRPVINFICLKCNENPIINGTIFRGYELKGIKFTSKYLKEFKEKRQQKEEIKTEINIDEQQKANMNLIVKVKEQPKEEIKVSV